MDIDHARRLVNLSADAHTRVATWRIQPFSTRFGALQKAGPSAVVSSPAFRICGHGPVSLGFEVDTVPSLCSIRLTCPPGTEIHATIAVGDQKQVIEHTFPPGELAPFRIPHMAGTSTMRWSGKQTPGPEQLIESPGERA